MPPLSIKIEKAVLSVLFNDSDKFISIESVLTTQCFYKTEHQILFDAIQSIHLDNAKINATSIIRKLYDLRNSDLMDVYRSIKSEYSSADQLFRNATLLAEFATKRALIENSQKLLSMCFNDEPMDTIDTLVSDGVNIATSRNRAIDGVKFIDSVEKMKIKMNRKLIDGLSGVTTGIKMIDNLTAGWQNDDIAIIAGRPGCFTGDTEIWTASGKKLISEIKIGDMILSRNLDNGNDEFKPATNFIKHTDRSDRLFYVKMKNGYEFRVTEDHEFFVGGRYIPIKAILERHLYKDEYPLSRSKKSGQLNRGDILKYRLTKKEDVFDITVADNHNFYLAAKDEKFLVSNSGKTASATFHAYEAAKAGLPVAFVSLEVEDESLTGRIVSNVSRTASSLIAKAQLAPNQKAHVEAVADQMSNLPIYYYPVSESWDINDISLVLRNWARRYGIKVIVIDFLQLITDRTIKGDNPVMVINSILYKIKKLRAILGIPFIIYSQLNRENEGKADKRPSLSGLKGSGAIEETGTVIIFLYREDYYNKAIAEAAGNDYINSDNLEYIFAKNRQGETGTMHLKCNIAQNRIYEIETKPLIPDTQLKLDIGK